MPNVSEFRKGLYDQALYDAIKRIICNYKNLIDLAKQDERYSEMISEIENIYNLENN